MEETVNLYDYLEVIRRRKWVLISTLIIIFSSVTIATFRQVPTYRATAVISINVNLPSIIPFQSPYPEESNYYNFYHIRDYFRTQYEILQSRDIARRVLNNLNLRGTPQFPEVPDPERVFLGGLEVEPVKESFLVKIHYQGSDPEEAARFANAVAQAYGERILDEKKDIGREAFTFLSDQLSEINQRIKKSETASVKFLEERRIYSLDEAKQILHGKIRSLYQELSEMQKNEREIQQQLKDLQGFDLNDPQILALKIFRENSLVQRLIEKRLTLAATVANLRAQYKSGHPDLSRPESELAAVDRQIQEEVDNIRKGLELESKGLQTRENSLLQEIKLREKEATNLNEYSVEYYPLQREVDTNQKIYDALLTRFQETRVFNEAINTNVKVLESAKPPPAPFRPNRRLNILLSLLVGLGLGTGLAFFFEYLETVQATIREGRDIEEKLAIPLLGVVPAVAEQIEELVRDFSENRESAFYESLRFIRANLRFSADGRLPKRILFVSSGPQEGKTLVMGSLAKILSDSGERVLIIDTDLRAPAVGKFFRLSDRPGLTDFLSGQIGIQELVVATGYPRLDVVFSGGDSSSPASFFEDPQFFRLLEEFSQKYDRVFFEAPPLGYYSDGLVLSRLMEGVVFIIYRGKSRVEGLLEVKRKLNDIGAPILGAVLNGYQHEPRSYYRHYRYPYPYGKPEEKKGFQEWKEKVKKLFSPWAGPKTFAKVLKEKIFSPPG
ncbi:MAG: polysaccharide biosynthesis tyrosine autokinase [Proteobacteria bacterium]|nr:polysaccharide biosynthesis tyrosine autokinase [Pseudomonadota bacterium]